MNRFINLMGRGISHVIRWMFVSIPTWIWRNIIAEAFWQLWASVRGFIRRHAIMFFIGSAILLLASTGQVELLRVLSTYGIAFFLVIFGFRLMLKGVFQKKKR